MMTHTNRLLCSPIWEPETLVSLTLLAAAAALCLGVSILFIRRYNE